MQVNCSHLQPIRQNYAMLSNKPLSHCFPLSSFIFLIAFIAHWSNFDCVSYHPESSPWPKFCTGVGFLATPALRSSCSFAPATSLQAVSRLHSQCFCLENFPPKCRLLHPWRVSAQRSPPIPFFPLPCFIFLCDRSSWHQCTCLFTGVSPLEGGSWAGTWLCSLWYPLWYQHRDWPVGGACW